MKIWHAVVVLLPMLCVVISTARLHLRATSASSGGSGSTTADTDGRGPPPPPPPGGRKKKKASLVFEVGELRNATLPHGTFFFAPHSLEADLSPPPDVDSPPSALNSAQRELLDDEYIDVDNERERCARYNFKLLNETHPRRRRLFMGALLGDDSMEVLRAVSTEAYNVYHTVSYIEGFQAHDLSPRKMNYYDPPDGGGGGGGEGPAIGNNLNTLLQLFGPKTKVSVDYYDTTMTRLVGQYGSLFMDFVGREGNTLRWSVNGMRRDDVGIIGDADEVFTRDFLRAMQVCDIPEFRPGQDCLEAQVKATTLVYESSPECLTKDRRWFHPDAILGECVNNVGDPSAHPPTRRDYLGAHGLELQGYGAGGSDFRPNYTLYHAEGLGPRGAYPLWHGTDVRMKWIGNTYGRIDGGANAYHFHNYFERADQIHTKYATYGHAMGGVAMSMPIWALQPDIELGVDCVNGRGGKWLRFNESGSSVLPIYYMNDIARNESHVRWRNIVKDEEDFWNGEVASKMKPLENENGGCWMECGGRSGPCPWFCGKDGACCRVGAENSAPECGKDRNLGCEGYECCVAAAQ